MSARLSVWVLSLACALGVSAGCSLLGTGPGEPQGLPHNGIGPFRDLTSEESGISRPGVVVLHRTVAVERAMEGGLHLFYAGATLPTATPDAGVPDAGGLDAGTTDAGVPDAGVARETDWASLPEGRRIFRSAPHEDDWGYDAGSVVLAPEGGPAWEGGYVTHPWAVETQDGALLYYAAAGGIGVARASSIDGTFTRVGDAPVLGLSGGVVPRCPAVVRTEGTAIEPAFFMVYEADGTVRSATSDDGLTFTDGGPIAVPPIARRDVRDGDEVEIGCPGASIATPTTGRRFVRVYYESRRDNGAVLIGLAATSDGTTFEAHPIPVVSEYDRSMPAPRTIDSRLSLLLQWSPRDDRGVVAGELRIGMAPGGAELVAPPH
jgi:hypothetical protein